MKGFLFLTLLPVYFHVTLCNILAEMRCKMKKGINIYLLLGFVLFSCKTSMDITVEDFGKKHLEKYNSYKFFNPKNIPTSNFSFSEENQKIIFDAIAAEMSLRGYTSVQNADLIIKVQGGTKTAQEEKTDHRGGYYDRYNRYGSPYSGGYGYPYTGNYDRNYRDISKKETTIIIDMIETRNDKLVWQGVAIGVFGKKEGEVELKIREAISRIYQKFSYQAGGKK